MRQSDTDQVTIVASCVTLVEALKSADQLAESGINVRVIDPFTIKPLDAATIISSAKATGGRIVTVEDHYPQGESGGKLIYKLKIPLHRDIFTEPG